MGGLEKLFSLEGTLLISVIFLVSISTAVLRSVAPFLFPNYFVYILLAIFVFYLFVSVDFEIYESFSTILYILSIIFLVIPLIVGQVTRGAIRWVQIGSLTIQPSEIVRAFLIIYFSKFVASNEMNLANLVRALFLFSIPFVLILIQPSLGVAALTLVGFLGVLISSSINKKYLLYSITLVVVLAPLFWLALQPYQKQRIMSFLDPAKDPLGAGYNSIQAVISVGSGRILGRGLGRGVQTQLAFLPEKHTDFIFATIAEELGFIGSLMVLACLFTIFWVLAKFIENPRSQTAKAYLSGIYLLLFVETFVHIAMNMGLVPITGVPLPFVSAGGSALIGSAMSLAIALRCKK